MRVQKVYSFKNRIIRELVMLFMAFAVMMVLLARPVSAATATIEYSGKDAKISFENVAETDLFHNFKGVMPGDSRSQEILLKSNPLERDASFYIKAEGDEKTKELLKDVNLIIEVNGKEIVDNGLIFDQVKLGTIRGKGSLPIKITMNFPLTLGNEVVGEEFHIKWHITVQEDGKEIAEGIIPSKPETGDSSKILVFSALLIASAFAVILFARKKYKN